MQSSLIVSDMKTFLDKYSKFITKDIYISKDLNQEFLDSYDYLKKELEKNRYLYQDSKEYKKFFGFYEHSNELIKLHNQKYLKKTIQREEDFFDKLSLKDVFNKNEMMTIFMEENDMVVISKKNYIYLIVARLKYMSDYLHKNLKKILILVEDSEDKDKISKELSIYDIDNVIVESFSDFSMSCLEKKESMLCYSDLYDMLFQHIIQNIYPDKKHFKKFYEEFSENIYLNKDYQEFDTFRDYHCYLYKRKFLDSKLKLKKYNEKEIKNRKGQLRTVDNVYVFCKEDVDVGNFLYLNSIDYKYDKKKKCFIISSNHSFHVISFDDDLECEYEVISLNKKENYLENLVYELVKRQYGMERRNDDDIYAMLRDSTIDSYFSDFIREVLIPNIYYYQEHQKFDDNYYTKEQIVELDSIYQCYIEFMKKNCYVDEVSLRSRVQDKIYHSHYDYFVSLGKSDFCFPKNSFIVLKKYPEIGFMKENMRLNYHYRSYVNDRKLLAISHVFYSLDELENLTNCFVKDNLDYLNEKMVQNKKDIFICFYEEDNKLRTSLHMVSKVYSIVSYENKKIAFGFLDKKDMKVMLTGGFFIKKNQDVLQCEYGNYDCISIFNMKKKYDVIILPQLISNCYYHQLKNKDEVYQVKMGLYMALNQCRDSVYLLCPTSKKDIYVNLFKHVPNTKTWDI